MTQSEKISMVSVMIEVTETNAVLSAYLDMAASAILNRLYPFGTPEGGTVPNRYHMLQCEIAAYLYARRGVYGQTGHDENGVKRTYESASVPDSMLAQVTPYVGVI